MFRVPNVTYNRGTEVTGKILELCLLSVELEDTRIEFRPPAYLTKILIRVVSFWSE
jgi:hypothetical protein